MKNIEIIQPKKIKKKFSVFEPLWLGRLLKNVILIIV